MVVVKLTLQTVTLLPGWTTQPGLLCVVLIAILLTNVIRITISHPFVSSSDCMIVIICSQMVRKTLRWLKRAFLIVSYQMNITAAGPHFQSWSVIMSI